MARLQEIEKANIVKRYGEGEKIAHLANEYGVAYNSVKGWITEAKNGGKYSDVLQKAKEKVQKAAKDTLAILERGTPYHIADKILNIVNNEALLRREIKQKGLSGVNSLLKTIIDSALKYEELKIKRETANLNKLLNEDETTNDNFENAILESLKGFKELDITSLIEEDSLVEDKDV